MHGLGERRVALTPVAVASLTTAGHSVRVERLAGVGAGFRDIEYAESGAELVDSGTKAFDAELVVKVKEIQTDEWKLLNPGGMLFSFLHLGAAPFMAHELLARRITGIAFETVEDASKRLSILAPMSVMAGELAIPIAAHLLMTPNGGRGVAIADARMYEDKQPSAALTGEVRHDSLEAFTSNLERYKSPVEIIRFGLPMARKLLGFDAGTYRELAGETFALRVVDGHLPTAFQAKLEGTQHRAGFGITGQVISQGITAWSNDYPNEATAIADWGEPWPQKLRRHTGLSRPRPGRSDQPDQHRNLATGHASRSLFARGGGHAPWPCARTGPGARGHARHARTLMLGLR